MIGSFLGLLFQRLSNSIWTYHTTGFKAAVWEAHRFEGLVHVCKYIRKPPAGHHGIAFRVVVTVISIYFSVPNGSYLRDVESKKELCR